MAEQGPRDPRQGFSYFASAGMKNLPTFNRDKKVLFISYSNEDYDKVEIINKELFYHYLFEPLVVANKREVNMALVAKVIEGIDSAHCVIPILTKQSYKTQWINQEIGYAYCKKILIVPIIEKLILSDLKGIIHKQNDCPYVFDSMSISSRKEENESFLTCFRTLIKDLEFKQKTILET